MLIKQVREGVVAPQRIRMRRGEKIDLWPEYLVVQNNEFDSCFSNVRWTELYVIVHSDNLGNTPLHNSVLYYPSTEETIQLLLDSGASSTVKQVLKGLSHRFRFGFNFCLLHRQVMLLSVDGPFFYRLLSEIQQYMSL